MRFINKKNPKKTQRFPSLSYIFLDLGKIFQQFNDVSSVNNKRITKLSSSTVQKQQGFCPNCMISLLKAGIKFEVQKMAKALQTNH
jgi:3-methyladenine DNA glycosylase AlkC